MDEQLLFSVREIFSEKRYGYNIPEYQCGYKWTAENVTQLLDDLKHFRKSGEGDFYCLQNITVTESDKERMLNVIDGQQRLTTLYLLLSFLKREGAIVDIGESMLNYSIREETNTFLHNSVATGKIWDVDIDPEEMPTKDQYYMAQVCRAIKEWFAENELDEENILDNTKLIVNRVEADDEEQVFANINGGKVDLDGADLIRAILITRASRQKFPDERDKEKIASFRVQLGMELDSMNLWWAKRDVAAFYERLLPNRIAQNSNFNYRDYPIDLLYFAFYEAYRDRFNGGGQKDIDIRVFENGLDLDGKPKTTIMNSTPRWWSSIKRWLTGLRTTRYSIFLAT